MVVYRIVLSDDYVKEAQRLILAQNRTLRLLYQTPWVWWFPRVTFAVMLIILLVVRLPYAALMSGAFLVLTFIGEFHSRWVLTKARNRIRAKGSTTTLRMDENGIDVEGALGHSHLVWAAVRSPVIVPDGVILKLSSVGGMWLPDAALVDGSAPEVRQLLAAKVQVV